MIYWNKNIDFSEFIRNQTVTSCGFIPNLEEWEKHILRSPGDWGMYRPRIERHKTAECLFV